MADYTKFPVVLVNKYLWDLASGSVSGVPAIASAVWNTSSYSYRPFFPVSDSLAVDSTNMPYVLYDVMFEEMEGTFWPLHREVIIYRIVGKIPQIYYVRNFIKDNLEKFDESARDINNHIKDPSIHFKHIYVKGSKYVADERQAEGIESKYITSLEVCIEYTKS